MLKDVFIGFTIGSFIGAFALAVCYLIIVLS